MSSQLILGSQINFILNLYYSSSTNYDYTFKILKVIYLKLYVLK